MFVKRFATALAALPCVPLSATVLGASDDQALPSVSNWSLRKTKFHSTRMPYPFIATYQMSQVDGSISIFVVLVDPISA